MSPLPAVTFQVFDTPPIAPDISPRPSGDIIGGIRGNTVAETGTSTGNQSWQDYSQEAATGSAQNPYSSIYGRMGGPLSYLRDQGIDVGSEYSRYFQDYDPSREQAAYQQYGLGQQSQMMGARAGLMGMTQQQQGAGGFAGFGFGGAASRGIRGQFGLGQQQAALGLRGDIYGMRKEQEESWWDTLARVEESRGEPFGMLSAPTNTYVDPYAEDVPSEAQGDPDWMPPANPTQGDTYFYNETTYHWDEDQQEWSQDI